jgi:hypothetical protein
LSAEDNNDDGNIFENREVVDILDGVQLIRSGSAGLDAVRLALGNVHTTDAINAALAIAGKILTEVASGKELQFVDAKKQVHLGPLTLSRNGARERVTVTFRDGTVLGQDPA